MAKYGHDSSRPYISTEEERAMSDQTRIQTPKVQDTIAPLPQPLTTPRAQQSAPIQAYQRIRSHPYTLAPDNVRVLQRTVGNRLVARLIAKQRADQQRKATTEVSSPIQQKLHPTAPPVQREDVSAETMRLAAQTGIQTPPTTLPYAGQIQQSFGRHDVSNIQAHVNEAATESAIVMNAAAYATGSHVVFAGTPDLHTAAHEAAHIVQQQGGVQLAGGIGQVGDVYEQHADAVAKRVVAGQSATDLLDRFAPEQASSHNTTDNASIQRQLVPVHGQPYQVDDRDPHHTQQFTHVGGATWQDQVGYQYNYTANEEFLILSDPVGHPYPPEHYWDVVAQVELTKEISGIGGQQIHIYYRNNNVANWHNRYYYDANHLYQPVPTARVRWRDTQGQFVDEYERVLTNNGQRVQKRYAITKDATRNYVLPYKRRQGFLAGLPNIFGGNADPGELAPATTVNRETEEESLGTHQLAGGVNFINTVNQGGNQLNFYEATVAQAHPPLPPPANPETAGTFSFKASDFTITGATTDQDIRDRIIQLFEQATHVDTHVDPFFTTALPDQQGQTPLQQFAASHTINALVTKIRQDYQAYHQGLQAARTNNIAVNNINPEYVASHTLYAQGLQNAQANTIATAAQTQEPAYMAARTDYTNGLQDAQNNVLAANAHQAYTVARTEYANGLQDAQNGVGAANAHHAYTVARTEYTNGWQDVQNGLGAANAHHAYMTARTEYTNGEQDAQQNDDAANAHVAYMAGYNSHSKKRKV